MIRTLRKTQKQRNKGKKSITDLEGRKVRDSRESEKEVTILQSNPRRQRKGMTHNQLPTTQGTEESPNLEGDKGTHSFHSHSILHFNLRRKQDRYQ